MFKRILIIFFVIATASFWITPLHEGAHWLALLLVGEKCEGVTLAFQGPLLVGAVYSPLVGTGGFEELLVTAAPWIFIHFPTTIILFWKWRKDGLFLATLNGQGGLYGAYGLLFQHGDAWALVQIGIPNIIVAMVSILLLVTAAIKVIRYIFLRANLLPSHQSV